MAWVCVTHDGDFHTIHGSILYPWVYPLPMGLPSTHANPPLPTHISWVTNPYGWVYGWACWYPWVYPCHCLAVRFWPLRTSDRTGPHREVNDVRRIV